MSFLVLHMKKFKQDDIRGMQSHARRERKSHTNPDIDYGRSVQNYDLYPSAAENYPQFIQNRIDDLLSVKAVRKDAVRLCGLIVSSDSAFFERLLPEETRHFFEESAAFLTEFVGRENVISAMVHMHEKTPHMHFLHMPVTPDGRLNANKIYTRESLRKLQTELPRYLQERGFDIQRGVEQTRGSAKKHLDTREFKQQQAALAELRQEAHELFHRIDLARQEEAALQERLQSYERQAQEAEKMLAPLSGIPQASVFNYKSALAEAGSLIRQLRTALSDKHILENHRQILQEDRDKLKAQLKELSGRLAGMDAARAA